MEKISHEKLNLSERPLIVCDVDEVVLEFIKPFNAYMETVGHQLEARSFKLHGNVFNKKTNQAASDDLVSEMLEDFFIHQESWQTAVHSSSRELKKLSKVADIVFLTAMPERHLDIRKRTLEASGFPYPVIATENAKGPTVDKIHAKRDQPIVFIDDIFYNLHSVLEHVPDCLLVNFMSNEVFRKMAPDPGPKVKQAENWLEISDIIHAHFST